MITSISQIIAATEDGDMEGLLLPSSLVARDDEGVFWVAAISPRPDHYLQLQTAGSRGKEDFTAAELRFYAVRSDWYDYLRGDNEYPPRVEDISILRWRRASGLGQ